MCETAAYANPTHPPSFLTWLGIQQRACHHMWGQLFDDLQSNGWHANKQTAHGWLGRMRAGATRQLNACTLLRATHTCASD